ncbi:MAG: hypothetical protein WDO13_12635 [Verrucomicrobiota bacterium]
MQNWSSGSTDFEKADSFYAVTLFSSRPTRTRNRSTARSKSPLLQEPTP